MARYIGLELLLGSDHSASRHTLGLLIQYGKSMAALWEERRWELEVMLFPKFFSKSSKTGHLSKNSRSCLGGRWELGRSCIGYDILIGKLTHQDLGQLQMYVNYYDRCEKQEDENPTIGILLCSDKNDTVVKMALPENNSTILASKYQLYLPTTEQLIKEIDEVKQLNIWRN